jgi:hypothetical protein
MPDSSYKQQDTKDLKLVESSKEFITESYNYAKKKFLERKIYNDLYYVNADEYKKLKLDHQAKFLSSQYHSFAEQKICLYAQGLTGTDIQPFFIYSALDNPYAANTAKALTKLAYIDLLEDQYQETNYKTCQHFVVDGFAIERPFWNYRECEYYPEPQKVPVIDNNGNTSYIEIESEPIFIPEKDHAGVKSIAPNDLWVDPKAKNEEQLRYLIERHIWTFSYLKQLEREGKVINIDLVKDTTYPLRQDLNSLIASLSHDRKDYQSFYEGQFAQTNIDKEDPLVEVLCVWRRGYYYLIANERILIARARSLPWLKKAFPHVFYSNFPNNYRFDGVSDFFFNQFVIKEGNKVANMLIDNVHKHLNPTTFINGLLPGKDIEAIKSGAPNVAVQSIGSTTVQQYRPDMPSDGVVGLLDSIVGNAKDSMAVTDFMAGQSPGSEFRTTGSIQIAAQLGQIRSAVKLQMLANRKRDIGSMILDLYRYYLQGDRIIQAGGSSAQELAIIKSDLDLKYNIDINIAPAADILRSYELQAMRGLFSDFAQIPGFNMRKAATQMASKAGVWKSDTDLFVDDPNAIVQANMEDAEAMGMAPNPAFAGMNSVQSPDAGKNQMVQDMMNTMPTPAGQIPQ